MAVLWRLDTLLCQQPDPELLLLLCQLRLHLVNVHVRKETYKLKVGVNRRDTSIGVKGQCQLGKRR